jgi:DNA transformation protein
LDAEGLKDLFAPFGAVTVKRMFGGHGVYADGLCFAIESRGEVFVKVDAENQPEFVAAGSKPFVYNAKGRDMTMAYWLLVAGAYDDDDVLKRWAGLGLSAAQRAAAAKAKPRPRAKKPK